MGVEKVFMGFIWKEKGWSGLQGKSAEKNFRRELHCNLQTIRKSELPDNLKVVFCLGNNIFVDTKVLSPPYEGGQGDVP